MRLSNFEEHLELHRLDCTSSHGDLTNYEFAKSKYQESPPEDLRPRRLLGGADLIAAGYRPGPEFSKMLDTAEDAQLEGRVKTKGEALELVQTMFGSPETIQPPRSVPPGQL
jgi:poly(A) polymerase